MILLINNSHKIALIIIYYPCKFMLNTKINDIELNSCIYNASGCLCTTSEDLNTLFDANGNGAVISKSNTLEEREGNPKPRWYFGDNFSINSMGVPNLGYKFYTKYTHPELSNGNKLYIQSIIPFSIDDMETILSHINDHINNHMENFSGRKRIVEINLSCPNIIKKKIVGYDFDTFKEYLDSILEYDTSNLVLGIKLPPYDELWKYDIVCDIIRSCRKIKFVTCINSIVNGLVVDVDKESVVIKPKEGLGGIGGSPTLPQALANVNNFYKRLGNDIDIIGCGGVMNGEDVFRHILCGASAVQIGTKLMIEGPQVFERISKELLSIMGDKGYNEINDFKGKLNYIE